VRIATWNVNSLRTRIDRVEAFLDRHDIDVLAVQETKAREEQLPLMGLQSRGYDVAAVGYNQWNGVALISRQHSEASDSRHESGQKLQDCADLVLDTGAPAGDAMTAIDGMDAPVSPLALRVSRAPVTSTPRTVSSPQRKPSTSLI